MAIGEVGPGGHLLRAWDLADISNVPNAIVNLGGPFLTTGDTGWTSITVFTNGWGASGTPPQYRLSGNTVYLRGAMTAGTGNLAAFTLPAGYRPTQGVNVLVNNQTASANLLSITTAGVVTPLNSATVWLSGVSFLNV